MSRTVSANCCNGSRAGSGVASVRGPVRSGAVRGPGCSGAVRVPSASGAVRVPSASGAVRGPVAGVFSGRKPSARTWPPRWTGSSFRRYHGTGGSASGFGPVRPGVRLSQPASLRASCVDIQSRLTTRTGRAADLGSPAPRTIRVRSTRYSAIGWLRTRPVTLRAASVPR